MISSSRRRKRLFLAGSERLYRALLVAYPKGFRQEFGEEMVRAFGDLCEEELFLRGGGVGRLLLVWLHALLDLFANASAERSRSIVSSIIKQPSAFVPMAMSLAALAVVLGYVAIFGVVHEADEGAAAHVWQLLMAAQVPVVAFFAIKWLPRAPRQALPVLGLQAGAVLAACAPVFFLGL